MASLSDLPDEILLLICDELHTPKRVRKLLHVSKKLYKIALPLVLRHVALESAARAQRRFCATFVLRHDLARLVKSVYADIHMDYKYKDKASALADEKQESINDEAIVDRLVARVCDIFHDDEDKRNDWTRAIEVQDTKYMVPLALVHLPNVTDLQMGLNYDPCFWNNLDVIFTQLQNDSRMADGKKAVQKLERVFIDSVIDKYPVTPSPLAIVAKWPDIRSIRICAAGNEDSDKVEPEFTDLEPKSRDLEYLELCPNSKLLGGNLHGLLGVSRCLREFKYHIGHPWAWIDFHTLELQKALDQQRETLERMMLWYDPDEHDMESDSVVKPMKFSAYTQLTDLSIDAVFLFDVDGDEEGAQPDRLADLLPASLKNLHVVHVTTNTAKRVAAGLKTILQHRRKFPDLDVLEVSFIGRLGRMEAQEKERLTKVLVVDSGLKDLEPLAKEVGIKFRLMWCRDDSDIGLVCYGDLLDSENDVESD